MSSLWRWRVGSLVASRGRRGIPRSHDDLVSVGFPIMLAGLLFGLLTTIDRWLILIYLDRVQVGYYGIVGITVSGLLLLPGIVSQQYYPRLAFAYGAGRGGEALLALASRQSLISGGLVVRRGARRRDGRRHSASRDFFPSTRRRWCRS